MSLIPFAPFLALLGMTTLYRKEPRRRIFARPRRKSLEFSNTLINVPSAARMREVSKV